jgi:hypothetical protein
MGENLRTQSHLMLLVDFGASIVFEVSCVTAIHMALLMVNFILLVNANIF